MSLGARVSLPFNTWPLGVLKGGHLEKYDGGTRALNGA